MCFVDENALGMRRPQFFREETARRKFGEFLTVKIASLARATSVAFFPHLHRIILACALSSKIFSGPRA